MYKQLIDTKLLLSVLFLLILTTPKQSVACKGCLTLDEYNFAKIINRFDAVLVKFDVAYPYGDKHDTFVKLADDLAANDALILAQVPIKDYGDKENENLARKYGIDPKTDLPTVRLFVKGEGIPVAFKSTIGGGKDEGKWLLDDLRAFIRDNTNVYLGLPGCLKEFDALAMSLNGQQFTVDEVIERAVSLLRDLSDEDEQKSAEIYIKYMRRIGAAAGGFVQQELQRLGKLLTDGKMNARKKTELSQRLNILRSFSLTGGNKQATTTQNVEL